MSGQTSADPISPVSPEAITPRQREVAKLVAAGRTNAEIAEALGITRDGAKYHVSELLTRLGLCRREEVAEWYRAHFGPVSRVRSLVRGFPWLPFSGFAGGAASVGAAVAIAAVGFVAARGVAAPDPGPPDYTPFVQEWEIEHVGDRTERARLAWNHCGEWTYSILTEAGAAAGTSHGDGLPDGESGRCHIPGVWFRPIGAWLGPDLRRQEIAPFTYESTYRRDCSEVSNSVDPDGPLGPDFCAAPTATFEDRVVVAFDPETQIPMRYSQYVDGVLLLEHRAVSLTVHDQPLDLGAGEQARDP